MKTETPQILWHNGKDNEQNKNAPIFSISLLESGIVAPNQFGLVLATAGNHEVNLWKLQLSPEGKELYSKLDRNTPLKMVKVDLLTTLTRHDATVNAVQFSPNGLHLATASDSGSIIIYSIPPSKRGGGNGQHYWSSVEGEQQLSLKILSGHDGIYDLDWSSESRRLVVGTLDHCMAIYEDENYATNAMTAELQKESQWTCMYRNSRDHSHYIQGVAMDPQGTYVASMSCDRTVRVYSKKQNKKKKVASDKLELGKGKLLKYYTPKEETAETTEKSKRFPLFAEEAASESFFRRLAWTADGAYLVTPAALWKDQSATLMFRRHCYDAPCKVLPGHDKVRVCDYLTSPRRCCWKLCVYLTFFLHSLSLAISCYLRQPRSLSVASRSRQTCRLDLQVHLCCPHRKVHFNLRHVPHETHFHGPGFALFWLDRCYVVTQWTFVGCEQFGWVPVLFNIWRGRIGKSLYEESGGRRDKSGGRRDKSGGRGGCRDYDS